MASRRSDQVVLRLVDIGVIVRHPRLAVRVRRLLGRLPRAGAPSEYSERMLFRKALDRNPTFVVCCDKLATKAHVAAVCPELPMARTLWRGADVREAPADVLARDVYVKANHGYGWNVRTGGGPVDLRRLHRTTRVWLWRRHGRREQEWGYREVVPELFIEEAIGAPGAELLELEIRAGGGRIILSSIVEHMKCPDERRVFVDELGAPLRDDDREVVAGFPDGTLDALQRALVCTRKLAIGVDYARFDFLVHGPELYGGEITIYPAAGAEEIPDPVRRSMTLDGWDLRLSHPATGAHRGWRRFYASALRRHLESAPT